MTYKNTIKLFEFPLMGNLKKLMFMDESQVWTYDLNLPLDRSKYKSVFIGAEGQEKLPLYVQLKVHKI